MTLHVANSEIACVASEIEEIVMVERIIVPITFAKLYYAEDVK
jgi:hypothetical protein